MATLTGENFEFRAGESKTLSFTVDADVLDLGTTTFTWTAGDASITKTATRVGSTSVWEVAIHPVDTTGWTERTIPHQLAGVDGTGAEEVVVEGVLTILDRLGDSGTVDYFGGAFE